MNPPDVRLTVLRNEPLFFDVNAIKPSLMYTNSQRNRVGTYQKSWCTEAATILIGLQGCWGSIGCFSLPTTFRFDIDSSKRRRVAYLSMVVCSHLHQHRTTNRNMGELVCLLAFSIYVLQQRFSFVTGA
jgi:hypothetical protein